jgi:putative colanic acid biosynthesis acetyltransferase WcaF
MGPAASVDLSRYSADSFQRGAGTLKEAAWLIIRQVLFELCPFKASALKCLVLRAFGAQVGRGVTIKPHVKITFPWKLVIGNNVWLGEECLLLNLARITIDDNVCVSQRAFLCTGSHNFKSVTFDLIVKPIHLENGAWLSAGCWVAPGVTVGTHAVLTAGSVATHSLEPWGIYQGNPAALVKHRRIENGDSMWELENER